MQPLVTFPNNSRSSYAAGNRLLRRPNSNGKKQLTRNNGTLISVSQNRITRYPFLCAMQYAKITSEYRVLEKIPLFFQPIYAKTI